MNINGINIWTYGLFLSKVNGLDNHPARKKVLTETQFMPGDIKYKNNIIRVKLAGKFTNYTNMKAMITWFDNVTVGEVPFQFTGYNKTINGRLDNGATTTVNGMMVTIEFEITEISRL